MNTTPYTSSSLAPILYPARCEQHTIGSVIVVAQGCPAHQAENAADVAGLILAVFTCMVIVAVTSRMIEARAR